MKFDVGSKLPDHLQDEIAQVAGVGVASKSKWLELLKNAIETARGSVKSADRAQDSVAVKRRVTRY